MVIDFDDLFVTIFSGIIFSKICSFFLLSIDWDFFFSMGNSVKKSEGKNLQFFAESNGLKTIILLFFTYFGVIALDWFTPIYNGFTWNVFFVLIFIIYE